MSQKTALPYGTWNSKISPDDLARDSVVFQELLSDGNSIYFTESRPQESGRTALLCSSNSLSFEELLPTYNVKSKVHEYGGGAFFVKGGIVFFSHHADQKIYRREANGNVQYIAGSTGKRYADFIVSSNDESLIAVCEDHEGSSVKNYLVYVDLTTGCEYQLASGHDFYSSPRLSKDGRFLAFITWDFPQMPWDGSKLWIGEIDHTEKSIKNIKHVAGNDQESIIQPLWDREGKLFFLSDQTGYFNLYSYEREKKELIYFMEADFCLPPWLFGRASYAFYYAHQKTSILCIYTKRAEDKLGIIDLQTKTLYDLKVPFTVLRSLTLNDDGSAYFFAGSPMMSLSLVRYNLSNQAFKVLKSSYLEEIPKDLISTPKNLSFFSGKDKRETFGFYYTPHNPNYAGESETLPPLILRAHSGPTGHSLPILQREVQYWTSRGFAFVDVNYGGSTGYGKKYRNRLLGKWGVVDVEDCIECAKHLVDLKFVDKEKLFIKGGSAGGYTALCSIISSNLFKAAIVYYGVADLEMLARDTHKFESRYLDLLVAPYPKEKDVYKERSPLSHVDKIQSAVLILQGREDPVVPLAQSEKIFRVLKAKKNPVSLLVFEEESHGFKMANTIIKCVQAEQSFLMQVLKLNYPQNLPMLLIENL